VNPPEKVRTCKTSKRGKKTSLLDQSAPQAVENGVQDWSSEFLAEEQRKDPEIGPAMEWVSTGQRPPWEEVKPRGPALCALWRQYESLVLKDNVLCRIFHKPDGTADFCQTMMPASLRPSFMALIHGDSAAHLKFAKSAEHLARMAWWYSWRTDLQVFIDCYSKCAAFHRGSVPRQAFCIL